MGLDPGFRTGTKVAVVDGTGKVVAYETIYPHQPQNKWDAALATLAGLVAEHGVELIAIGNGTASRETDTLATELIKKTGAPNLTKIVVSEAGASVYSASAYASQELPDLDVSIRGAVSIARRLQDPLAELVKIDPKSIGVGQYQHDITESLLSRSLDAVVEDAVNSVGVDVNTASVPLLARVSGIAGSLAESIVAHRDQNGPFKSRKGLKDVSRLGPKAFEQCAGFLRITDGDDPLDASSVHPEAYPVVRKIVASAGGDVRTVIGNSQALRSVKASDYVDERFGLPTVTDIIAKTQNNWRIAVSAAVQFGVAVPAFSASLAYFDSYRSARLPSNLLQAQRDFFGAHTYERVDKPGVFHTEWIESDHNPVQKSAEPKEPERRHAGE